ncbi:MAG: enoyl-CoA hydratase-related protein [Dehalococcoidales bacterium]
MLNIKKKVKLALAAEILLTGNRINAQDALRVGLISHVIPKEKLLDTTKQIANTIITMILRG